MIRNKKPTSQGRSEGSADYWDLLMEDVPGAEDDYRVDLKITGEDATGTLEIWLSAREDEGPSGVRNTWENGVRLPREQAAKLRRFLEMWLAAGDAAEGRGRGR